MATNPPVFSAREAQLLTLFCEGFTPREIAKKMGIDARTVAVHKLNIRRRIGGIKGDVQLYQWIMKNEIDVNRKELKV